jgi:DNA-binding transcriptional regulator YiaG
LADESGVVTAPQLNEAEVSFLVVLYNHARLTDDEAKGLADVLRALKVPEESLLRRQSKSVPTIPADAKYPEFAAFVIEIYMRSAATSIRAFAKELSSADSTVRGWLNGSAKPELDDQEQLVRRATKLGMPTELIPPLDRTETILSKSERDKQRRAAKPLDMKSAAAVRAIREHAGLSEEEFAELVGISKRTVVRREAGEFTVKPADMEAMRDLVANRAESAA